MKKLLATICFLGLAGLVVGVGVFAGENQVITATVQPLEITISITLGHWTGEAWEVDPAPAVDYGDMEVSQTKIAGNPYEVWNSGNVWVNILARGADATDWTLSDVEIGADQYMHEINFGDWGIDEIPLSTVNKEVFTGLSVEADLNNPVNSMTANLRINTPTSFATTNLQSTTVTLVATQ